MNMLGSWIQIRHSHLPRMEKEEILTYREIKIYMSQFIIAINRTIPRFVGPWGGP